LTAALREFAAAGAASRLTAAVFDLDKEDDNDNEYDVDYEDDNDGEGSFPPIHTHPAR
jgi:hypothetical protein